MLLLLNIVEARGGKGGEERSMKIFVGIDDFLRLEIRGLDIGKLNVAKLLAPLVGAEK